MKAVLVVAVLTLVFPAAVAARTHKITLDLHSAPEGAQVTINTLPRAMGATPLALTYTITGDCGSTEAIRVRWASGAETLLPALQLCAKSHGGR